MNVSLGNCSKVEHFNQTSKKMCVCKQTVLYIVTLLVFFYCQT